MTDPVSSLRPPVLPRQAEPPAQSAAAAETAREFETVFLTQFVDEMMKTAGDTAFGGPQQAEMWRSFMSEAVAGHLAAQGGMGLTGPIEQMIGAYAKIAETSGRPLK